MKCALPFVACFVAVAVVLATLVADSILAKGYTGGSNRPKGGSSFRASKTGYYSSRYGYASSAMYWRSGYMYNNGRSSGYVGSTKRFRSGTSISPDANIMCRRLVLADNNTDDGHLDRYIVYNSTQWCYEAMNTVTGSRANTPVDNLMLSRYRFNLSILPYPQIDLLVYPDKDIIIPSVNSSFRLNQIAFAKSRDNATDVVAAVDLSTLQWEPCTLDGCQPGLNGSHMGAPSSRFVEGSRVFYSAVRTTWRNAVDIELRWWLSTDFSEDPNYEHIFMFPGAIKFDLRMRLRASNVSTVVGNDTIVETPQEAFAKALGGYAKPVYLSVEALFAGPDAGAGSALQYLPTPPGKESIEYNPQSMERVVFGTVVDQANGKSCYLSFPTADNRYQLCYPFRDLVDDDSTCMKLYEAATLNDTTFCRWVDGTVPNEAEWPAPCRNGFLREGQRAIKLHWIDQGAFGNPKKPDVNFYWNHGFHDPTVVQLSAGIVRTIAALLVLLLLALLS